MSVHPIPEAGRGGISTARRASDADKVALARTMARAFLEDPFVFWLVPDRDARMRKLPSMFALLFRLARAFSACDVTANVEAAALWRPPDTWHIPFRQYVVNGPHLLRIFGGNTLRALGAMDTLERRHPREPHWYLQAIGTDPAFQGKGYGGVLLRHRLSLIDAEGLPAYLEASKESNIPLYAGFGFALTGEIEIRNGPVLYPMWRASRHKL
ncbi:MAG: GNAT family N-acetyltransferase [Rhizomicrobium sp.]